MGPHKKHKLTNKIGSSKSVYTRKNMQSKRDIFLFRSRFKNEGRAFAISKMILNDSCIIE